jgi:hypothetical protein
VRPGHASTRQSSGTRFIGAVALRRELEFDRMAQLAGEQPAHLCCRQEWKQ